MDSVQHRLFHFEAQPPAKVWDNIDAALDKESQENYTQKLQSYEPAPPAGTWGRIEAHLNKHEAPVLPFGKRFSMAFRYGAAAAVLIIAALIFTSKKPSVDETIATANSARQDTPVSGHINQNPLNRDLAAASSSVERRSEGFDSKEKRGKNFRPISRMLPPAQSSMASLHNDDIIIPKNIPVVTSDIPERYIVFSKTTGEAIRLSKKLFDLFACADDTENCRKNIEFAQQQMASTGSTATADFGGVLELLQNMNHQ